MTKKECKTCNRLVWWPEMHKCPPEWKVGMPEYDGDNISEWGTYYADSAEAAATQYGQSYDENGDYNIVRGSSITVTVIDGGGTYHYFEVSGESIPSYTASRLQRVP